MNRIILIGNGFDLAHGLKTKYTDFMDWYWRDTAAKVPDTLFTQHEDELITFERINGPESWSQAISDTLYGSNDGRCCEYDYGGCDYGRGKGIIRDIILKGLKEVGSYDDFKQLIVKINEASDLQFQLSFKNEFWKHISEKNCLQNWLDIENEYYDILKSYLKDKNRNERVKKLNAELCQVKDLLEKYLTEIFEKETEKLDEKRDQMTEQLSKYFTEFQRGKKTYETIPVDILSNLFIKNGIERRSVAILRQTAYADCFSEQKRQLLEDTKKFIQEESEQRENLQVQAIMAGRRYVKPSFCDMSEEELDQESEQTIERQGIEPQYTLVLNFNYTSTFEKVYSPFVNEIINIHGQLNDPANPIIFGYGDDLDDDYKEIEKINDNDFLDNMKQFHYHNTANYRRLLEFLQNEPYQVFIMGHSCGNSDRTLLNTIFEHENCISIKPFYHQWKDEKTGRLKNNYNDIYKNISRNFNDKQNQRDIVVNKEFCTPLVPCQTP